MPKYVVKAEVTFSAFTEVDAPSQEEAIAIASEREVAQLSISALYPEECDAWHYEPDGEPENIRIA
jgi:hypothetical protein